MQHLLSEDLGPLRPLDEAATRQHTKKDFTIGVESKEFTTRGGATVPAQVGEGYAFGRASVEAAVAAVAAGKVVMVVDDADRENEGDFIMAAEKATAETIGFIVRYSSGVLCASLEGERLDALALPPMVVNNQDPKQTAYSVSVDHKDTSTGISAADRALTFRELVNPLAQVGDFQRPGHVFPLRYKPGGTLTRRGHTEASLDLSGMAGLRRGAVLAEVVHDDGSMMRLGPIEEFALAHGLVLTSVQDIAAYRSETEAEQL
jgi:3,4-dihydroxy-2-butanone 4-phosphate synthase